MDFSADLLRMRLRAQLIEPPARSRVASDPASVVAHLCAMQAQDYAGALWAVGLRSGAKTTVADVERAIEAGRIVRTWPMRGTLHFVAAEDVRWMLGLLAPRVAGTWERRHRELGLTADDFSRAAALFEAALTDGVRLTRAEMLDALERNGISTEGQRGYHVLGWLAQQGLICLGPMAGGQQTFVLLDEWVPRTGESAGAEPVDRAAALARLARRYFAGHGPATLDDLARWTGITKRDAAAGVAQAGDAVKQLDVGGTAYFVAADAPVPRKLGGDVRKGSAAGPTTHLLPGFDEYYIGYRDKSLVLGEHHEAYASRVASNGVLRPTVVVDGCVVGIWQRAIKRDRVDVVVRPFRPLTAHEQAAVADAATRYAAFLGREAAVAFERS